MTPQEQRIERLKKAGIPLPITQLPINEGAIDTIPVTAQNADKHARLQALKSGANRQLVQSLVKAKTVQNSFEGIPEPSQKRKQQNFQGSGVDPAKKVPVREFAGAAPVSDEFSAMEAMYGGGNTTAQINMNTSRQPQMNTTQPDLTIQEDGYGPAFDPMGMIAAKKASMQRNNPYLQHVVAPEAQQNQQVIAPGQQQFDFNNIKKMMEEIAKNTISEVLNNYTEKNKDKLTYENVNVKTTDGTKVIKTQDGNYYKLVPVKLKNS